MKRFFFFSICVALRWAGGWLAGCIHRYTPRSIPFFFLLHFFFRIHLSLRSHSLRHLLPYFLVTLYPGALGVVRLLPFYVPFGYTLSRSPFTNFTVVCPDLGLRWLRDGRCIVVYILLLRFFCPYRLFNLNLFDCACAKRQTGLFTFSCSSGDDADRDIIRVRALRCFCLNESFFTAKLGIEVSMIDGRKP